jgi:hypothetical protein
MFSSMRSVAGWLRIVSFASRETLGEPHLEWSSPPEQEGEYPHHVAGAAFKAQLNLQKQE